MKNDVIKAEIKRVSTVRDVSKQLFFACTSSLYDRLNGEADWKVTELITLSRICNWTVEQFLDIIDYKEKQ